MHNSFIIKTVVQIAWFVTGIAALNVGLMVMLNMDLFSYLPFLSHEVLQYIIGACGLISLIAFAATILYPCLSCQGNCPCLGSCTCK